jgi:DNA-binding FadR family transcriptional regulator
LNAEVFTKLKQPRLPEVVAGKVEEAIIAGVFAVGSQLPSEQQLADQFGVSRNVVREAFKFLKERGLIEILNGSGAYVRQPSGSATSNALDRYLRLIGADTDIAALYEARRTLEGANARLAAQRATIGDLNQLSECLRRMTEHAGAIDKWAEADLDFHLGIARATQNPFLGVLLHPLVDRIRGVIAEGYLVPGAVARGLDAHRQIFAFVQNRDTEGAFQAIMAHLKDSETSIHLFDAKAKKPERQNVT